MNDPAEYGRQWAQDYDDNENVEHAVATAKIIDDLAQGGLVLEVAAGTGRVACRLNSPNVVATDASEDMLNVLRSKSSTVKTYVEVLPNVSGGPYQVIAILANSLWVMRSASEQYQFVLNAKRELRPGGYLVVEHSPVINVEKWQIPIDTPRGLRTVSANPHTQQARISLNKNGKVRNVDIRWVTDAELSRWTLIAGLQPVQRCSTELGTTVDVWQKV